MKHCEREIIVGIISSLLDVRNINIILSLGSSIILSIELAVSSWKFKGLSPLIFPSSSLSQNINTLKNSDVVIREFLIISACLIEITFFVSSSEGLLSFLDIVRTAGCLFSLIHLQLRHWQVSDLSPAQFSNLAISFAIIYCDSKSCP